MMVICAVRPLEGWTTGNLLGAALLVALVLGAVGLALFRHRRRIRLGRDQSTLSL